MVESLNVRIGKRIRKHREFLGITRKKLAEKAGLSVQFLADIELGRKNMSTNSLYKIAKALSLSADYILFGKKAGTDKTRLAVTLAGLSARDREIAEDILKSFVTAVKNKADNIRP